jgi:hypothetical protein
LGVETFAKLTERLQGVLCSDAALELGESSSQLFKKLRAQLRAASDDGLLETKHSEIYQHLTHESDPAIGRRSIITYGKPNFHRVITEPHILRDDGAWFDFGLTLEDHRKGSHLLAYHFEIRFPDHAQARFLRIDLNKPEHANEDQGLRSHFHPSDDDILFPSAVFNPSDALSLFIHGMRRSADRKPRTKGRTTP